MNESLFINLAVIGISFVLALSLTARLEKILHKRAIFDIPNARSSHKIPTPRGCGWAIVAVLLPALLGACGLIDGSFHHVPLIVALTLLVAISWADDCGGVSAAKRLGLHLVAACLGCLCFAPDQLLFGGALPFALDRLFTVLGWAWFINLYNFMDGIDGITGVQTVSVATGTCLVMTWCGIIDPFLSFTTLVLTGVSLGFLGLNWHPAKIFLGDIGSVPLGFVVGFGLIVIAMHGHPLPAVILPLYYLADSGITIAKRALRGEKIWQPHRQHFYQKAALGAGRHDTISLWVAAANCVLIMAAIVSINRPWLGLALAIVTVAVLLQTMHKKASALPVKS